MAGVEPTDIPRNDHGLDGRSDGKLTAELGRLAEAASIDIINRGLPGNIHVTRTGTGQLALPKDFPLTGHPDGELCFCKDGLCAQSGLESLAPDGLKYGFEHKFVGRFSYKDVLSKGIEVAHPEWIQQVTLYAMALGWDAVCLVVLSQDGSSIRYEVRDGRKKKLQWASTLPAGWNPKVMIGWIDLRGYKIALGPSLLERAAGLSALRAVEPGECIRDFDPKKTRFPCGWCDFKSRCIEDGQGVVSVTPAPMGHA